jgi:hypothetical protein
MDVDGARFALSGTSDDEPLDAVANGRPMGRDCGDGKQAGGEQRGAGGEGGLHRGLTLSPTVDRCADPP